MKSFAPFGWLAGVLLSGLLGSQALGDVHEQRLRLVGHSTVEGYSVKLTKDEWAWLRSKQTLVVGASPPYDSPFELGSSRRSNEYEGLVPDYVKLVCELLGLQAEVIHFANREEALAALKSGRVDVFSMARDDDAQDTALSLTRAYVDDRLVMVSRNDERLPADSNLSEKRLAMVEQYSSAETLATAYPRANIHTYPSVQAALAAVVFGRADAYIGEAISAGYLIYKQYPNDVQVTELANGSFQHFSFALPSEDRRLLDLLNTALEAIPLTERLAILRRWNAGGEGRLGQYLLSQSLSASEQYWLKQHPRLRVAVNHNFMPISFVDGQGKFKGIGADVLATISQRTGLQFDFVYAETSRDLVGLLERGDVDLLATVTKSAEREAVLKFTRPYISEPIVLVTPFANKTAFSLNDMNGLKVAVTRGTIQSEILRTRYPAITAVEVPSVNDALNMTVQGEVDGALGAMMSTRYKVIAGYSGSLQIAGAVEDALAETAIATQPDAVELNSILSKALLSIAPEEMDALTSHWRGPLLIADSFWGRYQKTLTRSLVIGVLLLLIVLVWAGYLVRLIRQRSRAELALNEQMEFMRVLIDGTPHPIYVRDREGRLLICNSGYLKAFNVEREAVLGRRVTEGQLLTPEAAHACQEMYIRVMAQGVAQIQDHTLTLGSGVSLTAYHWVFPYQNIAGDTVGIICGWIDVSERQQLFKQLEAALEGAEVANRAKTTFLSVMSHEIRTPLNAVIGMLDLMLRKNSDERIDRHSLAVAAGAASELQMLVGDILDVARIESGHLSLTPERAGLRALVESVVRVFEGGAREKGLALILDFAPQADREVLVDPLRFKQVVSNLLSNAIKFTFNGEVLLTVSVLPSGDSEELKVCLRIKDSGIGISKDDQLQLFTPFTQASNNNQSARSGSGLGLVISRTLCEMMQGQLELASSLGRGTQVTMIVSLPLLAAVERTEELGASAPVFAEKALSILIVDDYPANRLLLTQQLNYLGHQVVDAEDGVEGLHQWRKGGFDVVITDINMPFMQGMELSRIIRKEELAAGVEPCLILGFTANARADERLRCIEAGMDDCMFKPISLGDLSSRLGGAVETPPAAEPVTPTASYEIDLSGIEQMARGDKASIDNLLDKLLASNCTDAEDLEHLLNAQDIRGISLLAHRVKGGAKMIRMASLVLACEQVENACEAAEPKAVKRTVETLQAAMLRLTEQLMIHR